MLSLQFFFFNFGIPTGTFESLTRLELLDLSANKMKVLPENFVNMKSNGKVYVHDNELKFVKPNSMTGKDSFLDFFDID